MTLLFDPMYLAHALKLGFLTMDLFAPDQPILATKASDLYLWMPCVEESAAPVAARQPAPAEKEITPKPRRKSRTTKTQAPKSDLDVVLAKAQSGN